MKMKNPPHFGRLVRQECLETLELTVIQGAKILGITRKALNNLVHCLGNCKPAISPEMATRLDKAFGGGAETWLRLQAMAFHEPIIWAAFSYGKPQRPGYWTGHNTHSHLDFAARFNPSL